MSDLLLAALRSAYREGYYDATPRSDQRESDFTDKVDRAWKTSSIATGTSAVLEGLTLPRARSVEVSTGLSPEILAFAREMQAEIDANAHKGEPGSWARADVNDMVGEVVVHIGRLHSAVLWGDEARVRELSADVANLAMMVRDCFLHRRATLSEAARAGDPADHPEACPKCGHAWHAQSCFNAASDSLCDCESSLPVQAREAEAATGPDRSVTVMAVGTVIEQATFRKGSGLLYRLHVSDVLGTDADPIALMNDVYAAYVATTLRQRLDKLASIGGPGMGGVNWPGIVSANDLRHAVKAMRAWASREGVELL